MPEKSFEFDSWSQSRKENFMLKIFIPLLSLTLSEELKQRFNNYKTDELK
jgi:hypothetical protein